LPIYAEPVEAGEKIAAKHPMFRLLAELADLG
jgi:hypothetical protein